MISELAPDAADRPEKDAEQHADKDRRRQRKGDGPSTSAPVEVAGKTAERQMKAVEPQNYNPDNYQKETKKNKDAAEVRHTALSC
jgi:hypothetical protein